MDGALPAVCLLAGGRGVRLGALTDAVPKPMIEVGGRPFIEWPLRLLGAAGFERVVVAVGYRGDLIADHLGNGADFGLDIEIVSDGPVPLGTLGALRAASARFDEDVAVLYADTILDVDFADVVSRHRTSPRPEVTMTVLQNRDTGDMSNAVVEDGHVVEYSKNPPPGCATWIDYGFFVARKSAVMGTADADLAPLLSRLAGSGDIRAYPVSEPFHEIGTPEALRATEDWIRSGFGGRLFPDA